MAFSPITAPPQFHVAGSPASGYYLKAYRENTTTAIQMATDSTGGTLVNKIQLNAEGYPNVSGTIVVPHIDEAYKLALYPDETSADNDSTGSAIWLPDNLQSSTLPATYVDSVNTLTDLRGYSGEATTIFLEGASASGDGSAAMYHKATGAAASTYTDDGERVIVPTGGDGSAAWLRDDFLMSVKSSPKTHNEDYTLVRSDSGRTLVKTSADTAARTWTIPLESSVSFPVGTRIWGENRDDNKLTITADSTATLVHLNGTAPADGDVTVYEGEAFELYKQGADAWSLRKLNSGRLFENTVEASFSVGGGSDVTISAGSTHDIGKIVISVPDGYKLVIKRASYFVRDSASGTDLRFRVTSPSTTWDSPNNQDDESPDQTLETNTSGSSTNYAIGIAVRNPTAGSLDAPPENSIVLKFLAEPS